MHPGRAYAWRYGEWSLISCVSDPTSIPQVFENDPSTKDWVRLQRYASWMRGLHLEYGSNYATDTLSRISSNSPGGLLFPKLESLGWKIDVAKAPLPFYSLFLSPHLRCVTIYSGPYLSYVPGDLLAPLAQMISILPSSLEYLSVMCGQGRNEPLNDAVSSLVCRCGPLLRSFGTSVDLSGAATDHLMQLPNLSHWTTAQGPPRVVPTSIFPSLKSVYLDKQVALPWLHLLASHERGALRNGSTSASPHTNIREILKSLNCSSRIADSTLMSFVVRFRNLVTLGIHADCYNGGSCAFRLTDDNIEDLVAALPGLKSLQLGAPCWINSCDTTVASLLSISVHCPNLTALQAHFSTRTIVSDMQRLLDGGAGRDRAKCKLWRLAVWYLPLEVGEEDIETVVMGFKAIFPRLKKINSRSRSDWDWLESKLVD